MPCHLYSTLTSVSNFTYIISYNSHLDPHSDFVGKEMETEWCTGMAQSHRRPVLTHVKPSQVWILFSFSCPAVLNFKHSHYGRQATLCRLSSVFHPILNSRIHFLTSGRQAAPTPQRTSARQPCSSVIHRHWYYKSEAPRTALYCPVPNVNSTYPDGLLS